MPNEFITRNGIISRGNLIVSGSLVTTQPTTFSGSLTVDGDILLSGSRTIQPVTSSVNTKGPTLTLLGGLAGTSSGNGGDIVIKGGNGINTGNTGGDVYIQGGDKTGSQRTGYIYVGTTSGAYQVYLQGAPIFNWDGPNASNAAIFQRGGGTRFSIYDDVNLNANYYFNSGANTINAVWNNWKTVLVKGSGTTSSTTAFQVQNANASSSFLVRDDSTVTIGSGYAKTINLSPEYGGTRSRISGGYGNGYLEFGGVGYGNISRLTDNEIQVASDAYPQSLSIGPAGTSQNIGLFNYSIKSGSATHFFVSSSGNVGVGTTSPSASFTVNNTDVIFGSNAGYGTYYGAANDGTFQVKANGSETAVWLRPVGNSQNFGSDYWSSLQTAAASLKVLSGQYGSLYFGAGSNTLLTIYNPTSGAGHVGIGTTTPHYKLQVVGTAYSGSFNANDQVVINTAGNMGVGTTAPTARLQAKGSGTTSSTTALLVQNANASSSLVVKDNSTVIVGTGTPTTSSILAVYGNSTTESIDLEVYRDFSAIGAYRTATLRLTTRNTTGNHGGQNIDFRHEGINSSPSVITNARISNFSLDSGNGPGSFAISTTDTAPYGTTLRTKIAIDNYGNIQLSDATDAYVYLGNTYAYGPRTGKVLTVAGQTNTLYTGDHLILRGGSPYGSNNLTGGNLILQGGYSRGTAGSDIILQVPIPSGSSGNVLNSTYQTAMFISGSGNIGIGTLLPAAKIHISGSSNSTLFEIDSPTANNIIFVSGSGNVGIGTGTPTATLDVSGSARLGNITFATSGTFETVTLSRATLTSNFGGDNQFTLTTNAGTNTFINVGYGNLNLNTGISAAGSISLGGVRGRVLTFGGGEDYIGCADGTGGNFSTRISSWSNIEFGPTSGFPGSFVTRYTMTSDGFGIYVPAPTARLQVKGSGTTSSTTALLVQNANASSSLAVLDNGYVGIGTSSPARLLHLKAGSGATGAIRVDADNGNVANVLEVQTNGDWAFNTNSQETMRLYNASGGRVGIGTISPSAKLDVSGSGNFTNSLTITGSLLMPSGSNTRVGSDVLTAGSVLINNTTVTANSLIFVTPTAAGTLTGTLRITAIVPSTSFTVSSTSITDTAAFSYFIVN